MREASTTDQQGGNVLVIEKAVGLGEVMEEDTTRVCGSLLWEHVD